MTITLNTPSSRPWTTGGQPASSRQSWAFRNCRPQAAQGTSPPVLVKDEPDGLSAKAAPC